MKAKIITSENDMKIRLYMPPGEPETYVTWFSSDEARRSYDEMLEDYGQKDFEGYAHPDSPRGRRIRKKYGEKVQREPRRGPRQVRVLNGQLSSGQRFAILKRDGYRCRICGASQLKDSTVELHVDHITPCSRGGNNDPMNLWTLCAPCNRGKGTQDM